MRGSQEPISAQFSVDVGKVDWYVSRRHCFEYCDFRLFRLALTSTELRKAGVAS